MSWTPTRRRKRPPVEAPPDTPSAVRSRSRTGPAWMGWAAWLVPTLAAAALVALGVWVAIAELQPPAAMSRSAAAAQFSAARAMAHVRAIAASPRPIGSASEAAARRYILAQLRSLGLTPRVQTTTVVGGFEPDAHIAARVTNIVARLPGSASTGAIALNAHYDSAPSSPGASDCGSCVATVLETARALRTGPRLRNDVLFVFTDGEESQDIGAHAFAAQNPAIRSVATVINFDTSGSHGAVYLARASSNSRDLVDRLVASAPHPRVFSFIPALMTLFVSSLRPGTDAEEYFDRGVGGVALYYSGGSTDYHTTRDSVSTISPGSLQEDGDYALALTRDLGDRALHRRGGGEWVAFNITPDTAVIYGPTIAVALGLAAVVLLVVGCGLGIRRGGLRIRGLLSGVLVFPVLQLLSALLVALMWAAIKALVPDLQVRFLGSYQNTAFFLGLAAAGVAVTAASYQLLVSRARVESLALGALWWWAALALFLALVLPGASYPFTWPLLAALLVRLWALAGRPSGRWHTAAGIALPLLVCLVLFVPVVVLLVLALGTRFEASAGFPIIGFLCGLAAAGVTTLFIPYLGAWPWRGSRPLVPGAAAVVAVALFVVGAVRLGFDARHPRPDTIDYVLNADTGRASWVTADARTDAYTRQFFPGPRARANFELFGLSTVGGWAADAPRVALPAPRVRLLSQSTEGNVRTMRLRLVSPRHAQALEVHVSTGPITSASIDGQTVTLKQTDRRGELKFIYWALPPAGITLILTVPAGAPVRVSLHDISYGLPVIPGHRYRPRPADTMAGVSFSGDAAMVSTTASFPA